MLVVIDIGASFTKCGFIGSTQPLCIFKTPHNITEILFQYTRKPFSILCAFRHLIRNIFYSKLLIDPSASSGNVKKVILLENLYTYTDDIKKCIALILNKEFWVKNLIFVPTHLACLYSLGLFDVSAIELEKLKNSQSLVNNATIDLKTPNFDTFEQKYIKIQNNTNINCAFVVDGGFSQFTFLPICDGLPFLIASKEYPGNIYKNQLKTNGFYLLLQKLQKILLKLYEDENIDITDKESNKDCFSMDSISETNLLYGKLTNYQPNIDQACIDAKRYFEDYQFIENLAASIFCVCSQKDSHKFDGFYDSYKVKESNPESLPTSKDSKIFNDVTINGLVSKGGQEIVIPGWVRAAVPEILFRPNVDGESISTLILDSIIQCPVDCRKALLANIVFIGGLPMIPGFMERTMQELEFLCANLPEYQKYSFKDIIGIKTFKYKHQDTETTDGDDNSRILDFVTPNIAAWTGASILFSTLYSQSKLPVSYSSGTTNLSTSKEETGIMGFIGNAFSQKSKILAVLNARRGIISKYLPREELIKMFGGTRIYKKFKDDEKDERQFSIDTISSNFEIKFPKSKLHQQVSKLYDDQEEAQEYLLIPDWNVIDPSVRPYGYNLVNSQLQNLKLSPFI